MTVACVAADSVIEAPREPFDGVCASGGIDVAGRLGATTPSAGLSRTFTLPRARATAALRTGGLGARVVVTALRSGGEEGYVGIDGESIVAGVEVLEARIGQPRWGGAVGAGLVDDAWAASGDEAWGLAVVAPTFGVEAGWLERSDVGAWAAWTAPERLATVRVELTSGEGARYRERNDGKDLAGVVVLRPLQERLEVSVYGRDGSRGLSFAQDHRFGARVTSDLGPVRAGGEVLLAWGLDGDAGRAPAGTSAWVVAGPIAQVFGYARGDGWRETAVGAAAWSVRTRAGLGGTVDAPGGRATLLAGVERLDQGEDALTLAGADALATSTTVFLQIGVTLSAASDRDRHPIVPEAPSAPR